MKTLRKISKQVPFGYDLHPDNDSLLVENEVEQDALKFIKEDQNNYSLRTLITVVHARTGRRLSKRGMQMMIRRVNDDNSRYV
jgi:hypothetical protein